MKLLIGALLALGTASVNAAVVMSEDFNTGIPGTWTVVDNEGTGLVWTNVAGCGETGNFTGGTGDAACASSDVFGSAEYDTELWTPAMDLSMYTNTTLDLLANYQNFASLDFFDIDVSTDGGSTWTNELSWNEDHGGFRATPGEAINLNLSAYDGQSNVIIRFRYYDPNTGDYNWYVQIDDVLVSGDEVVVAVPAAPVPTLGFWALALLMSLMIASTLLIHNKRT